MALIRLDHRPDSVQVNNPLQLIIPDTFTKSVATLEECQVLFLLHGLSDDASAWQRYTNIEILLRDKLVIAVMPSVGRSFYTDMDNGQAYYSYLTEELPHYLSTVFRLNLDQKKLLVAGNSMGGYGAFKLAFLNPQRFRAALSLSGVLSIQIFNLQERDPDQEREHHEFDLAFGGLDTLPGSDNDPATWLQKAERSLESLPSLHMACGTEDELLPANRWFYHQARALNLPITYTESPGGHDWLFWGDHLKRWLDLVLLSEK